jgi:hypothetical protein
MPDDGLERIPLIIVTTMGTGSWEADLPIDVPVARLIRVLISTQGLPFQEQTNAGVSIPYRLMWREGDRYLAEGETLREAAVQPNNTLVMAQEARAGDARVLAGQ